MVILLGQSVVAALAGDAVGGGWLQGGAWGQYYNNATLTEPPSFTRRDVRVDFTWGTLGKPGGSRSPGYADVGNQNFSVRWTGQIMPRFSESYTFKVICDAGARLYFKPTNSVTWTTLLDAWSSAGTNVVSTSLAAGQTYDFKLEYHETTGTPVCRLLWSGASTPEEVLDTATLAGLNVDTYAESYPSQLWANGMDGARDEWSDYDGSTYSLVSRDTNGWPTTDATNIVFEGAGVNNGAGVAGTYLLQFQGRALVSANVFGTVTFVANGTNYGGALPFGAGYNATSNLTTATLTISNNAGILYLGFQNTRRNPGDSTPTGVSQVKLMRPVSPGSSTYYAPGTYFYTPFENAVQRYTILRWIANFDTDIEWTNRPTELPAYSTHNNTGGQRYWEQMVMLANECGKDLYVCLPVRASNNYLTNVANLIYYGSDGVNPYTSPQANPVYPPLNPNLRVILEHENEVWNWAFANAGNNITDLLVAYTNNTPDWNVVNYDGVYTGNPSGAWLRWHILRGVRASEIFRSVFGDAAMGTRVRMIYEYQYDDAQGTASGALPFIDNYFNNADGTAHVATPHPVNYYFWGGGGAVYYGSGNSDGTQTNLVFANSGFESPALAAGQAQTNPPGSLWTFTGNAGIYSAAVVTNVWNNGALGNSSAPASQAYGCRFTVGASAVAVYELGRWVAAGNSQTHTVYLVDTNKNNVASVEVNTSGAASGQYVYGHLPFPVMLSANTTYYLISTENSGGDTFYTNTAVTPVAGLLNVNSSVSVNTSSSGWDTTQWIYTNLQSGAVTFGPVNMRYAAAPVGAIGYPPNPPEGSQAAFIQGAGTISQIVTFTNPGTFALRMQCAAKENDMNTVRFYYDNTFITPNGSLANGAITNQWYPGQGWAHDSRTFDNYSTFVFQVTNTGPHTLTIQGLGVGQYDPVNNPPNTNLLIYFDELEVISADALFAGGIPGAGEANGQVASDNYSAQLFSQARYAQAYGLQVVAYEGGWSLGGDFGATAFQNWCKYYDPRAESAQLSSINTFARSGSRYYVFGTYETWPDYDTINAGNYPLTQAVDVHNAALPLDPVNGIVVPNVLTPPNNEWLFNANASSSTISGTGGWFYWNVLAPVSGNFVISATNQTGASAVLEVDGSVQGATFTGTATRTNFLTKGLHAIKVRSASGSFTVTNVTVTQIGAPNAPVLQSAIEGDSSVSLSWSPAAGGPAAQGYLVDYGPASGNYTAQISAGTATNWTVTGLTNGEAAYFTVVATNGTGYSLPSNERNATPVAPGQLRNLLVWDFTAAGGNAATDGNAASVGSTTTAYGIQPGTIIRGTGSPAAALQTAQGRGAMNMNSSTSWTATTLSAAKTAGSYFQFAVAPFSGNQFSLSSIAFVTYQQNSHAAATVVLEYSINGFATAGVAVATNNPISYDWNGATNIVSLSGISVLQNITNMVTFRIWGYGFGPYEDKGLGQVAGNNPDVAVAGTVTFPVAAPTFNPPAGTYAGSQSVTISTTTAGSTIRYTTDGSTPTPSTGTLYAGPAIIGTNTLLQAIAFQAGYLNSAVAGASYTINLPAVSISLQMSGSNLQLTWPQGTLLESSNVSGPWTTNFATSPYTVSPTNAQMFYRIRVQ